MATKQTSKNKTFTEAKKHTNKRIKVWAACLDTKRNIWKAYIIDVDNNKIAFKGGATVGKNNAYNSLNEKLEEAKKYAK